MSAVPSTERPSYAFRAPQAATTEGLYARHSAKILSYCLHQLGSREEAEDAVQTTFMNAFRALGRGVVPEAESAWLFKIAENVCLSRRRSSWRRGRIESPSDFEVIEEIVPGPSRQRDELIGIEAALAGMPEQQRRAILLREWQGLSYREIAEELELSQSAVETLIFRARRSLAQGLEQPDLVKPKRKSFRRALHMIDLGTIAAALKTLLAGSAAVKATAAAVAVTAVAGTAASVTPKHEGHSPKPATAPALVAAAPSKATASLAAVAAPAPSISVSSGETMVDSAAAPRAFASELSGMKHRAAKAMTRAERPAPVATAPAPPTERPAAAAPVEQAAPPAPAEPVQAPVAVQPQPASPAVEPPSTKSEPVVAEPAAVAPVEQKRRADKRDNDDERDHGRRAGKGRDARVEAVTAKLAAPTVPVPAATAPDPASTPPVVVEEQTNDAAGSTEGKGRNEKERGRAKNRRDLAVAPAPEPAAPIEAAAAPAPSTAPAPGPVPVPAQTSEPRSDDSDENKEKSKGSRRRR